MEGLGHHGQDFVAFGSGERLGDSAGNDPTGMDALVAEKLDDVLAEAAQGDAGAAQFGLGGDYAEDVPYLGVGLHAQQKVGRGQIEEAERVRLHHLREVEHAPQLRGGVRNAHGHDGFAGLGGRDQVRDRADAADARHQAGHFVEGAAFGELFEAAYLRHMKVRVFHFTLAVQLDGDFSVAFEAGNGIDRDGLAHDRLRTSGSKAGERRNFQRSAG